MAEEGTSHYAQIRLWLSALSHVVSRLERIHSAIVEAIVAFPWTTMDATSVKSYIHFIGVLLSARPEYLSLVLGNIAQGFTYRGSPMISVMLSSLNTYARIWAPGLGRWSAGRVIDSLDTSHHLRSSTHSSPTYILPYTYATIYVSTSPRTKLPSQAAESSCADDVYPESPSGDRNTT